MSRALDYDRQKVRESLYRDIAPLKGKGKKAPPREPRNIRRRPLRTPPMTRVKDG